MNDIKVLYTLSSGQIDRLYLNTGGGYSKLTTPRSLSANREIIFMHFEIDPVCLPIRGSLRELYRARARA